MADVTQNLPVYGPTQPPAAPPTVGDWFRGVVGSGPPVPFSTAVASQFSTNPLPRMGQAIASAFTPTAAAPAPQAVSLAPPVAPLEQFHGTLDPTHPNVAGHIAAGSQIALGDTAPHPVTGESGIQRFLRNTQGMTNRQLQALMAVNPLRTGADQALSDSVAIAHAGFQRNLQAGVPWEQATKQLRQNLASVAIGGIYQQTLANLMGQALPQMQMQQQQPTE